MDIRAALLNPELKTESVYLPSLGVSVTVKEMNAERLEAYESLIYQLGEDLRVSTNSDHMAAKIAVYSVIDENGELMFKPEDVEALSQSYGKDLKAIADAGAKLSGLFSAEAVEKN